MELEIIILSEISQTEKDKYCIFSHTWNQDLKSRHEYKRGTVCRRELAGGGTWGE
jgi:hypothetical protein